MIRSDFSELFTFFFKCIPALFLANLAWTVLVGVAMGILFGVGVLLMAIAGASL